MTSPAPPAVIDNHTTIPSLPYTYPPVPTIEDTPPPTCPIHSREHSYHAYLGYKPTDPEIPEATAAALREGRLCLFTHWDRKERETRTFTGRVTGRLKLQRTRLLLQVTHHLYPNARFGLIVPYELYYSRRMVIILSWVVVIFRKKDSDDLAKGMYHGHERA